MQRRADDEIERIREKLRYRIKLEDFEADLLLDRLGVTEPRNEGAPSVMAVPHTFMARHYWWLRETGAKSATKAVARAWGVTPKAVEIIAKTHATQALQYVRFELLKRPDELSRAAVLQMFEIMGGEFAKLGTS